MPGPKAFDYETNTVAKAMRAKIRRQTIADWKKTPEGRYSKQKEHAKTRGIGFNLTFDEWWELWQPHYAERGQGGLMMCRTNDEGAYELGNVRIDTHRNNIKERNSI